MNYFNRLQKKINKYKAIYAKQPKKAVIKLLWWNFTQLFKLTFSDSTSTSSNCPKPLLDKISIHMSGGIGDILMSINYSCYLFDYIKNDIKEIDFYVKNPSVVKELIDEPNFNIYSNNKLKQDKPNYLLSFKIDRFPLITENNLELLDKCDEKLKNLVKIYKEFYQLNKKIVYNAPSIDSLSNQYSIINKQNRMQQPDIYGCLKISDSEYKFTPPIKDEKRVLQELSLDVIEFITINRGVDSSNTESESNKLYPLDSYNELVKLIKKRFNKYKIIQLGVSIDRCKLIDGVDIDLVGKTSLNQLKVILKNATLHIDCEGGMVHLRKSLQGGVSVVIFGPTSSRFYGYPDNINISSEACSMSCEWINDNWTSHCINKQHNHICMKSIKPIEIFQKIENILKNQKDTQNESII